MNSSSQDDTVEMAVVEDPRQRFFGPTPPPVRIDIAGLSDTGRRRENNEDHFAVVRRRRTRQVLFTNVPKESLGDVHEDAYSMVIADGMGGASFGELASRLVIETAGEMGLRELKWPHKMNHQEASETLEKIETYIQLLHESLLERTRRNPELEGMGTTFTVAYTVGPEAFIGHAGDSRAYLWRDGGLRRLTRDHTLAQTILDAGLTAYDANQMRYMSRVLTNCLGAQDGPVHADVVHFKLHHDDRLLLCTDGLTDLVEDPLIAEILGDHRAASDSCRTLVDLALERGGHDNITVIVARYELEEASSQDAPSPGATR
jgi:protein phosphatase